MYNPLKTGYAVVGQKNKGFMQNVTTKSIHSYIFCQVYHRRRSGVMRKKGGKEPPPEPKTGASAPVFSLEKLSRTQYPVALQNPSPKIHDFHFPSEVVEQRNLCYNIRQWMVSASPGKPDRERHEGEAMTAEAVKIDEISVRKLLGAASSPRGGAKRRVGPSTPNYNFTRLRNKFCQCVSTDCPKNPRKGEHLP